MAEILSYTRATIDALKKSLARITFIVNVVLSSFSLLYYVYDVFVHARTSHYILMGFYIALALLTAVGISLLCSKHAFVKFNKRLFYRNVKTSVSWGLIGLRALAFGFSFYDVFVVGVSDFNKMITLVMGIMLILQVILEAVKAYVIYYIELFTIAIERDKGTLTDDLVAAGTDALKKKAGSIFKGFFFKNKEPKEEKKEEEPISSHDAKHMARLAKLRNDFLAKKKAEHEEKAAKRDKKPAKPKGKNQKPTIEEEIKPNYSDGSKPVLEVEKVNPDEE